jgi:arylsulfatase A-like enzyme
MGAAGVLGLAVPALVRSAPAAQPDPSRPNIVFILADDLGCPPLGCYGTTYYETPHLDRLAEQGMRFTQAYSAAAICSPTRGALMTGQYPARNHLTDFIPGGTYPYARLKTPAWQAFLPLDKHTIAEALAGRGYVTAHFGKWHLAKAYLPPDSIEHGPDRQGFQETFITHKPLNDADPETDAHNVEVLTQKSIAFLERNRDRPFFLYLAHNSIHDKLLERRARVEKYERKAGADRPENHATIAAMMETLDSGVGRVVAKLDELGLSRNTLVIFKGDNGGLLKDSTQPPFRGGKAMLYEGGIRVPLIVRWPGVVAAGKVSDAVVSTIDFFPTLLAATGARQRAGEPLDGVDLLPHLRGGPAPARDAVYWHYPHYHNSGNGPSSAVRAGDWKLIEYFDPTCTGGGDTIELFNLKSDVGESRNLAKAEPQRTAALHAKLAAWRKSVGAQMMAANPNYDPARADVRREGGGGGAKRKAKAAEMRK